MTDIEKIQQWISLAVTLNNKKNPEGAQAWATIAQAEAMLALCKRLDRIISLDVSALRVVDVG